MSFGISFGSIGDLIAVGQLAWSLAQALNNSRGSAKEYQSLVKELQAFNNALLQVVALWQNYEAGAELVQLFDVAKGAVNDCRQVLMQFREKIEKKYGTSLEGSGSGSWAKDAGRKIKWLREKEDVVELRRKLSLSSEGILMLTLAAMGTSNKLDHAAQALRIGAVHALLQESLRLAKEQKMQLQIIDSKLNAQSETSVTILNNVKSGIATLSQVGNLVVEIRSVLGNFQKFIVFQQGPAAGLGSCWQQAPVTLEDARGVLAPIPLELINSWDMFETVLVKRFEKSPGHTKVLMGEYTIEDSITGQDFSRDREWTMCFRPGQKVNMSMVFVDFTTSWTSCPRCMTVVNSPNNVQIQCANPNCGMWFRRIQEVTDRNIPAPQRRRSQTGLDSPEDLVQQFLVKPEKGKTVEDQPRDFQRVRLVTSRRGSLSTFSGTWTENDNRRAESLARLEDTSPKSVLER